MNKKLRTVVYWKTTVEIAFSERSLRQLCENEAFATRKLGAKVAQKLKSRLADLDAAASVNELLVGRPRELVQGQFTIDIFGGWEIVFCSNHNELPAFKSGAVDWSKVFRIKILKIENPNASN